MNQRLKFTSEFLQRIYEFAPELRFECDQWFSAIELVSSDSSSTALELPSRTVDNILYSMAQKMVNLGMKPVDARKLLSLREIAMSGFMYVRVCHLRAEEEKMKALKDEERLRKEKEEELELLELRIEALISILSSSTDRKQTEKEIESIQKMVLLLRKT